PAPPGASAEWILTMTKRRSLAKRPKRKSTSRPVARKSVRKAKRPVAAPKPNVESNLDDLGKLRDEFRTLKADFYAADAEGFAAIKDHDYKALDRAATKEADIVAKQKRLSARLIELQKRSVPKP